MPDNPLTDLSFNILVALKDETLHGYALVKRLREVEGHESVRTGTVYAALARLRDDGLVEEAEDAGEPDDDSRRRYYRITEAGMEAARAEAARLEAILGRARNKNLLPRPARG